MSWRLRRVREMATLLNGFPFDASEFSNTGDIPLVRIRDLLSSDFGTFVPAASVPPTAYIRDGDVLIGMDGDFNVRYWSRGAAALNQRVCALRNNGSSDMRFLAYALPNHLKTINDLTYSTTVKHLSSRQVQAIRLLAPDPSQQRAIADFLDRETADIDLLIEKQLALIDRLQERRATAISRWVCGGMDPAVPTRRTHLQWLPEVPEHWSVVPIGALFRVRNESNLPEDEHLTPSQKYGVIPQRRYMEITGGRVVLNLAGADSMKHVEPGDVISHLRSFQGGLETSDMAGKVSQAYTVIRPWRPIDTDYYRYLFKSNRYVQALQVTTNQLRDGQSIRFAELRQIPLPFPPIEEQQTIATRVAQEADKVDSLITKAQRFVELARERRSALITAAVTGRIDVRQEGAA